MIANTQLQITGISIKNYRCLKDVSLELKNSMTVLIGKNASGKSTIIDCLEFISDAIKSFPEAIKKRGGNVRDITYGRQANTDIVLRYQFNIPTEIRSTLLQSLGEPQSLKIPPTHVVPGSETAPKINAEQLEASTFLKQLIYQLDFIVDRV